MTAATNQHTPFHSYAVGHLAQHGFEPTATLTPDQAAKVLSTTKATLSSWRCTGKHRIPFMKLGRQVRYPAGGLIEHIARNMGTHCGELKG